MNQGWQRFLESRSLGGAQSIEQASDFVSPLHADGLLLGSGEEASEFLQNQLGNDLRQVDSGHSQLSCYSNPKGRLLAAPRILQRNNDYLLRLPAEILEATLQRLRMFVLRARVELRDASDELACFGAAGKAAADLLAAQVGELPEAVDEVRSAADISVLRVAAGDDGPRYELYGPSEALQALWLALAEGGCAQLDADAWRLGDILAGLPNIYAATRESFVAQMTNLHLVNGLSFKKGCYPGQEIIARMQYLGQLKRRCYLFDIAGGERPQPGDELFNAAGKSAGQIIDAAPAGAGRFAALAVLRIEHAGQTLHCASADGPAAEPRPLPYAFDGE